VAPLLPSLRQHRPMSWPLVIYGPLLETSYSDRLLIV
jgi:hypothetical protein